MVNFLGRHYACIGAGFMIGMFNDPVNFDLALSMMLIIGIYISVILAHMFICLVEVDNSMFFKKTVLIGIATVLISNAIGFIFVSKVLQA